MAKKEVKKGNNKNKSQKTTVPKKVEKPKEKVVEEKQKIVETKEIVKTDKNKETKKIDKKLFILIGTILAIVIIIFVIVKCVNNPKNKITKRVKLMGESFYTEYYYKELSRNRSKKDLEKILDKYKDIGIKVNLNNLSLYKSGAFKKEIDSFMDKKNKCDGKKSKVIIYPEKPYGNNDFKVDVELNCEF